MRSSLVFVVLIVMLLVSVNYSNSSKSANKQTPLPPKTCQKPVACNCNLTVNQDSHVSDAIKNFETKLEKLTAQNLETKLEKLIALVNKISTPGKVT